MFLVMPYCMLAATVMVQRLSLLVNAPTSFSGVAGNCQIILRRLSKFPCRCLLIFLFMLTFVTYPSLGSYLFSGLWICTHTTCTIYQSHLVCNSSEFRELKKYQRDFSSWCGECLLRKKERGRRLSSAKRQLAS